MAVFQKSDSDKNVEILKKVYFGMNQNELDAVLSLFDAAVVRVEFEGLPTSGTYRGLIEFRKHLDAGRSTWAEGSCEPVEFFFNENKIVVTVHVKVRLKNESQWIDAYVTDGFSLKESRVTEFHSFINQQKAFEWAGISLPATESF